VPSGVKETNMIKYISLLIYFRHIAKYLNAQNKAEVENVS